MTNLQGDVLAILDTDGTPVVEYTYDAWGNLLSVTGSLTNTLGADNPLRYRGYVYDAETGFYSLQSRYYEPELGRFLNADALVSTGQGVLGNNMFAYCNNSPVNLEDAGGTYANVCFDDGFNQVAQPWKYSGGGGGGYAYAGAAASAGTSLASKIKDTIYNTRVTAVQANLQENGVAFYKGVPVFVADLAPFDNSAFSFGVIVMDDFYETAPYTSFSNVLNHEWGHTHTLAKLVYLHMLQRSQSHRLLAQAYHM